MSTRHDTQDMHSRDVSTPTHAHRGSPWAWVILLAIVLAASGWWLARERPSATPPLPATPSAPQQATPAENPPRAEPARTSSRQPQRKPAVAANRDPRPLAGNAELRYPPAALRAGIEGSLVAQLDIDARGNVVDASIIEHRGQRNRDLDRAVLGTVREWRFEPALKDGRAVPSSVRLPVEFKPAS
ncbi:energy transducer TonB [Xanthomonas sp.]|uniref:energy transducer TonB n=1 Tax=Xanthomonas sp. TaxID=29446 RepID=UPI001F13DBFF|nr:TonB family protein [Xanthomonas sp.]